MKPSPLRVLRAAAGGAVAAAFAPDLLAQSTVPITPVHSAVSALVGLALVVALIFVAGWVMRRLGGPSALSRGPIRVLGATSIGQRERVVLVRYGASVFLLGVAPGHVSLIKETAAPEEAETALPGTSFVARLRALSAGPRHD